MKFGPNCENLVKIVKFGQNCAVCTVKSYLWVQGDYLWAHGGYMLVPEGYRSDLGGYLGGWVTMTKLDK